MECPKCGGELLDHDYYGRICAHQDGKVIGDIYLCNVCADNGDTAYYHATRSDPDNLIEGYPC